MAQQKALLLSAPNNGEWQVGTREIPKPGPGDVLVKIHSTALNPVDWKIRAYNFGGREYPAVLGSDSAGTVEAVGKNVQGFATGDRIVHQGFRDNDKATFQQYAIVPAEIIAKIPENISFDQAASLPVGLATAASGLYGDRPVGFEKYQHPWEESGENRYNGHPIVIFGGSSSVGQYVIQLARFSGFSPIITTSSSHNKEHLLSLGATHVVDRSAVDVPEQIKGILGGASVKLIFDSVSLQETQNQAWDLLASGGQLVLLLPPEVDKDKYKDKAIVNVQGNVHLPHARKLGVSLYSRLTNLLKGGTIKPNRVEVLPDGLGGIPDGLERLRKGEISGKKLIAHPQETA